MTIPDDQSLDTGCQEYNALSRRQFLGTSAAGAAGLGAMAVFPAWVPRVVLAESHSSTRDVLLSIFLRGGADGLSLVAPFADPAYYTARPTIAIPRPDAGVATRGIALDNFFALPQALASLVPAYAAGDLLVVHASGQATTTSRSHFDAQRFMEVGTPADPSLVTGWVGRHLASVPPVRTDAPLRALGIASGLQRTLVGGPRTLPIANPAVFTLGGSATTLAQRAALLEADYATAPQPVQAAALDALETVELLRRLDFNGYVPANGAVYPNTAFGRALRSVAVLVKADVGLEAAQVDIGGWDTHAAQDPLAGAMFTVMRDFGDALGAFYADVIAPAATGVTAIAMSEFGRNVRQNGSLGTDHGRASAMFVAGKGIAGGRVLSEWPGLATEQLEARQDLRVTIDHRDILAEIVTNRLGNQNPQFVFPNYTPRVRGVTR
jgi:uncharacterized protein (DUF1501 family)